MYLVYLVDHMDVERCRKNGRYWSKQHKLSRDTHPLADGCLPVVEVVKPNRHWNIQHRSFFKQFIEQ